LEGLDSERGIVWRCSDSRSLGDFLRLGKRDKVPDHSRLSKTRSHLPHEVHEKVFAFVLNLVAERWFGESERIGVDGSTMEAYAALRTIVRRDNGKTYREMLTRMAKESGVETPKIDDLIRLDRERKGKKLSNEETRGVARRDRTRCGKNRGGGRTTTQTFARRGGNRRENRQGHQPPQDGQALRSDDRRGELFFSPQA
jgi:Transposase domain (DUF772)